jgi:membrane associated rhomboid family serine protease
MSYYRHPPYRPQGMGVALGLPPVTPVNSRIMIACGAVWVVQVLAGPYVELERTFGLYPAGLLRGWVWQLFTYMYLHSPVQIMHVLLNMLMLWMLGGDLERHWGGRRYFLYYTVCGVGAGILAALVGVWQRDPSPTIGASGAIYGLVLAYGVVYAERVVLFMMIFPMKARTLSWILFGLAFLGNWSQTGKGVSHIAHLGGMIVGYLYLKRAWRIGDLYRELRWRVRRRRLRVLPRADEDRWIH